MGWGGRGPPLPGLAPMPTPMAMNLHHGFPNAAHPLPALHSDPETGKGSEERAPPCPRHHPSQSHLHAVRAPWLGLPMGTTATGISLATLGAQLSKSPDFKKWTDYFYFLRLYLFIFRERGRGEERERNIDWLPLLVCTRTRD